MNINQRIQDIIQGKVKVPVSETVGFTLVEAGNGRAKFTMKADERHHNPMGTLHGGVLCDLADAAMGIAFASTLQQNELFTTINLQINFLKAIVEADLVAEGAVIKRGRSVGFVEATVKDSTGDVVATAQSSCKVLKQR